MSEIPEQAVTPVAGTPGTGWRMSDSGSRWFQIERGSHEWRAWMRFYRDNGRARLADFLDGRERRHWVVGASPVEHGAMQLLALERYKPKPKGGAA